MSNPTQFTYIVVVKQHDDLEQISADQMAELLQSLITTGAFVEVKAIEPIDLLIPTQPLIKGEPHE